MYIPGLAKLSGAALDGNLAQLMSEYEQYKGKNLKLDIQRGRPCSEQLDLAIEMLDWGDAPYRCEDGIDARNYGGSVEGTPEARSLFAEMFGVKRENVIVCGNSSLNIMYDTIAKAMMFGVYGGAKSWLAQAYETGEKLKFICPVPGYDRHFFITEKLGFEMINVDMLEDGPDMDTVERLVSGDAMIKGMWNVPKYSNPTGITYSDDVVRRFAALKPKADDFRIFWDNAYMVHDLGTESDDLLNLLEEAEKLGNQDLVYMFASTSKITFAGAGITAFVAGTNNIKHVAKQLAVQTIGADKLNQLRHYRYIKNVENLKSIMQKHAAILGPKFELVRQILDTEFRADGGMKYDGDICDWTNPHGGFFFSLDAPDNCAKEALRLASEAGVRFTPAGATFPYGIDPHDRNIRIAPSVPTLQELDTAMHVLSLCIKIAYLSK